MIAALLHHSPVCSKARTCGAGQPPAAARQLQCEGLPEKSADAASKHSTILRSGDGLQGLPTSKGQQLLCLGGVDRKKVIGNRFDI